MKKEYTAEETAKFLYLRNLRRDTEREESKHKTFIATAEPKMVFGSSPNSNSKSAAKRKQVVLSEPGYGKKPNGKWATNPNARALHTIIHRPALYI